MKKYFFIISVLFSVSVSAQIKISAMPTHSTSPDSAYLPIVVNGVNKKVQAFRINKSRIDSAANALEALADVVNTLEAGGLTPGTIPTTLTYLRTGSINDTSIYQTPDGGLWKIDGSDNSSSDNTGTILVNVNTRIKRIFTGDIFAEWFGVKADGNNYATQINNAIIARYNTGKGRVIIPAGTIVANSQINMLDGVYLVGLGVGATILDMSAATITDAFIYGAGSLTTLPDLDENVFAGTRALTFASNPSIVSGDVIIVHNPTDNSFSSARTYYQAGEYFVIDSVTDTEVRTSSSSYDSYDAGDVNVYKLNPFSFGVSNMTIKFKPAVTLAGIKASLCSNFKFENLRLLGNQYAGLELDRCFNGSVTYVDAFDSQESVGLNYGLVGANSQRIRISKCYFETRRHGLSFGGAGSGNGIVPNRDITITDSYIGSLSGLYGLDFHGNSEHCLITGGNDIPNGMSIGGDKITVTNNKISNSSSTGTAISFGEALGMGFTFQTNEITATKNFTRLLDNITPILSRTGTVFLFAGNKIVLDTFHSETYPSLRTAALYFTCPSNTTTEDWTLNVSDNKFSTNNTTAGEYYSIYINTVAAKGIKRIIVKNNTMVGAGFHIRPNYGELEFSGNTVAGALENGYSAIELTSPSITPQRTIFTYNTISGAKQNGIFVSQKTGGQNYSRYILKNNTSIQNGQGGAGYYSLQFYGAARLENTYNTYGDSLSSPNQSGTYLIDSVGYYVDGFNENIGANVNSLNTSFGSAIHTPIGVNVYRNNRAVWGTAAPTVGTWSVGDICWNTTPTVNLISLWRCTVAGTPGTWVPQYLASAVAAADVTAGTFPSGDYQFTTRLGVAIAPVSTHSLKVADLGAKIGTTTLGRSGTGYGVVGEGIRFGVTNNVYTYDRNDFATGIDFSNGNIDLKTAPSGSIAGTITFTSRLFVGNTGGVGIGTQSPNAASVMDLTSTTKGLLLPRMTKAQRDAISSPVAGLVVYQTDNTPGLRVYNGTNWMKFTETTD